MTNSTRFSPRRFWQVLRLDLVEGTQSALKHYGSAFLAFLAFITPTIPDRKSYKKWLRGWVAWDFCSPCSSFW